ncbi:DUF3006 domain-containing protein [Myxococcota bacterium]|nr:DUF3006 domain-containing protein [Myxococcota bacterium]
MSPRRLGLSVAAAWTLCVVDQIDGDVAAIELAESQLITLPLGCLPPAPHEGERLEARRVLPDDDGPPPAPDCPYQLRRPRGDGPPTAALASSPRDPTNTNNTHNPRQRRQP